MDGWQIALLLKPLGLVVLFSFTYIVARLIARLIPEGRIKRILFFKWKV